MLEATRTRSALVLRSGIFQQEADFNDSGQSRRHESIAKSRVRLLRDHEILRMAGHCPAGQQNDQRGDDVALRETISRPAEPHAQQTGTPPYNAHGSMLQVVMHPSRSPSMFGEGVDASP